jgi:hypothetical protein
MPDTLVEITLNDTYTLGDVADKEIFLLNVTGGADVIFVAPADPSSFTKIKIDYGGDDGVSDKATIDLSTFGPEDKNGNPKDLHVDIYNYDPTDQIYLEGAYDFVVDPGDSSKFTFKFIGSDGITEYSGFAHLKDDGEKDWNNPDQPINICFVKGTLILTANGEVPVEDLKAGDQIVTKDCGLQPVRWIGSRQLDSIDLALNPEFAPICIKKGAIDGEKPSRDLSVSPQHRICVSGWKSQLLFGLDTVLVAAKHLVNGKTIIQDTSASEVCYFHILFDRHQIIYSNGSPTESLHTGDVALSALDQSAFEEILTLFPELVDKTSAPRSTVLPVLKAYEARAMWRPLSKP